MKNWKTNLGGAISIIGSVLLGIGLLPGVSEIPQAWVKYFIAAGIICSASGKGITALFAADASAVKDLSQRITNVEGNTDHFTKPRPQTPDPEPSTPETP